MRSLRFCVLLLVLPSLLSFTSPSQSVVSAARALMQAGRYEDAETLLQQQTSASPHGLRLLLDLAARKGERAEAEKYARRLLQLHQSGQLKGAEEVEQAAYAAWQLDLWQDANDLFMEAAKLAPVPASLFVDWGNLYLEKYNAAEAESIFSDAVKAGGADLSDAYVGLAQASKAQGKPGTMEALQKALELNPQNLNAFVVHTSLAIEEEDWKEALDWIEKGLGINKNYLPLLEAKCALYYFGEETDRFAKTQEQILAIDPNNANLFEKLGEMAVAKRRLDEAVRFYRESVRHNPRQWSALASLGINLLRLGKEEEGQQVLEQAYENDPFNIWTVNTLRLLDSFDQFVRHETTHFQIKLHQKEAETLRPYVEELLERSLATLEQKYKHKVSGKYLFEMYPDHEDFAVRTLGLPGLGALGATFGRVVAMDSPSARPKGKFHWGSTLWHEMAHVVVLSLSNNKVPRWFTEGISMMEERQAAQGWGEYLTPDFIHAYKSGDLLSLTELNSGFVRPKSPRQMEVSYYQAGWICEFLASRFGFEKIRAMLVASAQGKTLEAVFKEVLGSALEDIDKQFREEVDKVLQPLAAKLDENNSEGYFASLQKGQKLHAAGRSEEAIPHLEKALQLFPAYSEERSPYDLLSKIYLQRGEKDKALRILREWWKVAPRFAENAHKLAGLLTEENPASASRLPEAIKYLEEALYVDPLDPKMHQLLGDLYLKTKQPDKAVSEFEALLSLKTINAAEAHYQLAEALFQCGQKDAARRQVLLSLEIAPSYELAQKLLLKVAQ